MSDEMQVTGSELDRLGPLCDVVLREGETVGGMSRFMRAHVIITGAAVKIQAADGELMLLGRAAGQVDESSEMDRLTVRFVYVPLDRVAYWTPSVAPAPRPQ